MERFQYPNTAKTRSILIPHVHLSIGNDIAPRAGEVATNTSTDSVHRLAHVDRDFVQVTKGVDTDGSGYQGNLLFAVNLDRR